MPIINPIWFYLSELCGNIKFISTMINIVFGIALIVMGIAYFVAEDEFENIQKNKMKFLLIRQFWKNI